MPSFLAALFFAPLALGSTETRSIVTAELLVALSGLLFFFPAAEKSCHKVPGSLPLLLLLCWMYGQCIALPVPLVRLLSPQAAAAYQPVLTLLPTKTWIPLTVNRQASLLEALRFSSYALFYLLTVQLLSRGCRFVLTVHAAAGFAIVLALLAILQRLLAPDTLFWFRKAGIAQGSFGPWLNRNQYAGFMVMSCPLALALWFVHRPPTEEDASWRERLLALFSGPGANLHILLGFGVLIVLSSVVLSQSRGGILSIACAVLLFFLLLASRQGKMPLLMPPLLFVGLAAVAGWINWTTILERFGAAFDPETNTITDGRFRIWQGTLRLIADFPLAGAGYGTFADMFPSYRTFADGMIYEHAHNDFLELLAGGGLIGFILAAWFVGTVLISGLRQFFRRGDRLAVLTAAGASSGLVGILLYSLTDFNLQNYANGLHFFFLCGLLISAGHTRQDDRPSLLPPATAGMRRAGFPAAAALLLALLCIHGRLLMAERLYRQARALQGAEKNLDSMADLLIQAGRTAPFSGTYPYALANIRKYQGKYGQALQLYAEAARQQPMEGAFLQAAGLLLADQQQAQRLVELGYQRAKLKENPLRIWAEFELSRHSRAKAIRLLRQALKDDPRLLDNPVYLLLLKHKFTQIETAAVLPRSAAVWLRCAELARAAGQEAARGYFLAHALDFLAQEAKVQPQQFMQIYAYWQEQKQGEQAAEVLRQGLLRLPDYAPFHLHLGDHYRQKGKPGQAVAEYEQARQIEPNNADIMRRIKELKDNDQ